MRKQGNAQAVHDGVRHGGKPPGTDKSNDPKEKAETDDGIQIFFCYICDKLNCLTNFT